MLHPSTLPLLQEGKNLLAYSGGVDSSALFFLLKQKNISFDLAIVNYRTREQSSEEVNYARTLAEAFNKKCYVLETSLSQQNFEAAARKVRYDFFETQIKEYNYTNLITAHQLDDRLEWLLMQLSKGAGLYELLGTQTIETRENYTLVRPLLETSRAEIKTFLDENSIRYFEDESNINEKYKRNFFRHNLAAPLIEKYSSGIKKSFTYLNEDLSELIEIDVEVKEVQRLHYFEYASSRRSAIVIADRILKEHGLLMRQGDKEALKTAQEHVVGRQYVVSFHLNYCFVAPYLTSEMSKTFKEKCRLLSIPQKLRPFLFESTDAFDVVASLLHNTKGHL